MVIHRLHRRVLGVLIALLVMAGIVPGVLGTNGRGVAHADEMGECTLIIPDNPLTAASLAVPYELETVNADAPCHEADSNVSAFVQAVIYNPANGHLSVYNPLVMDIDATPAVLPTKPMLPPGAVVGLWMGYNGGFLHPQMAFPSSHCVLTYRGEPFGQMAWCNTAAFYAAVQQGIASGLVHVPALGTALDGLPCPTTRDYSIVDQDPSDNVVGSELAAPNGQMAQDTAANRAAMTAKYGSYSVVSNGSDNALLNYEDPALGCTPWEVPVANDPGVISAAQPLNELQAALEQPAPTALVPVNDPFVLYYEAQNLGKLNAYRRGVDQPLEPTLAQARADQVTFCRHLIAAGVPRLAADQPFTSAAASPFPDVANSLYTFLAERLNATWGNLNCQALTGQPAPVTLTYDASGLVVGATYL